MTQLPDSDARVGYLRAIERDENDVSAWEGLGGEDLKLGRYREAEQAYHRAVQLEPARAVAWDGLGRVEFGLKRFTEARASFARALSLDADRGQDAAYWNFLGWTLLRLKMPSEALDAFQSSLALFPYSQSAWIGKARAYLKLWQLQQVWATSVEAVRLYSRTLHDHPWER